MRKMCYEIITKHEKLQKIKTVENFAFFGQNPQQKSNLTKPVPTMYLKPPQVIGVFKNPKCSKREQ